MPIDHAARLAQVARIVAHAGSANEKSGLLSWTPPGGSAVSFSANVTDDKRDPSDVDRDDGDEDTVRIVVSPLAFAKVAPEVPRKGQSFKDPAGRSYRIMKLISPPFALLSVYRCAVGKPLSS